MKTYFILIVNLKLKMRIYYSRPMFIGDSKTKTRAPLGKTLGRSKLELRI